MKLIRILSFVWLLTPFIAHAQEHRTTVNKTESPPEASRREGEQIMRAYFEKRLLKCNDSWWWIQRYQSRPNERLRALLGEGVQSYLHQAKGNVKFAFEGHYVPARTLTKAEQLNGVDAQPVEFEGNMSAIFDVSRCRNCIDGSDNQWSDNYHLSMGISKRHGQWIISEFSDPYWSVRKPTCTNTSQNVEFGDEYLTPKTRFDGDYRLKDLGTTIANSPSPQANLQLSARKIKVEDRVWQFEITLPPGQWFDTGIPVIVNKDVRIRTERKDPPSQWIMRIVGYELPRNDSDSFHIGEGTPKGDRYSVTMQPQESPTLQFYLKGNQATRLELTIEDSGRCEKCIIGCPEEHRRLHEQGQSKATRLLAQIGS